MSPTAARRTRRENRAESLSGVHPGESGEPVDALAVLPLLILEEALFPLLLRPRGEHVAVSLVLVEGNRKPARVARSRDVHPDDGTNPDAARGELRSELLELRMIRFERLPAP